MNAIVTARVPLEIKQQVEEGLKNIGATPTELINSAYEYFLCNGRLPFAEATPKNDRPVVKKLSKEQAEEFHDYWDKLAVLPPLNSNEKSCKELINEAREEYYARYA